MPAFRLGIIVIVNRIYREKQLAESRQKDFEDALNREAQLAIAAKYVHDDIRLTFTYNI